MICLLNDYNSLGCKEVLETITKLGQENNIGYGKDVHTANAINLIRKEIGYNDADIYFLAGGTITNRIGLDAILRPYEAVISVESGHINVHETGAVESTGHKILCAKGNDGKLSSGDILNILKEHTDSHKVLPRAVYISDSTEIGTIYTLKELKEISKVCHENDLYLFLDGARLGCALCAEGNDISLKDIAKYTDIFYIGGTKNGAPLGEALVITNKDLKKNFAYLLKNQGGLLAKGFLCGIIFETLFTDNLYLKNASNSIQMAKKLREIFRTNNIKEVYVNPTNQVFVELTKEQFAKISEKVLFEKWEENDEFIVSRFVTNFNTSLSELEEFSNVLGSL